jgi:outer membrane receptor protein involved in Fe transport
MNTTLASTVANRDRSRLIPLLALAASLLLTGNLPAQAAPDASRAPGAAETAGSDSDTVVLSPFEVRSDQDHGYLATSAQSGTRLRSDLKDIAASVSVVTKDFMNDIGARNLEDLLPYTLGTEVDGLSGNYANASVVSASGGFEVNYEGVFQNVTPSTRVRGLTSADSTRDFFLTNVPLDSYNVERVEISRGPNAMLFGNGSPGGIINSSLIRAETHKNKTSLQYRIDQYGSSRASIDHNQVLIPDKLALRLAAVYDQAYYQIEEADNETHRAFLTGTYRPFHGTTIKASTEWGQINSNRPRINPPNDDYTMWWDLGQPTYDLTTGLVTLHGTPTLANPANANGGPNGSVILTSMGTSGLTNNMTLVYADPLSSAMGIPGTAVDGYRSGSIAKVRRNASGGLVSDGPRGLADYSRILNNVVYANDPTKNFWRNQQLTDPGIYDFYHHMLDGPNKWEWSDFKTYNVTLEQQFLNGQAGIEASWDRQNFDQGNMLPLSSQAAYTIRVDINEKLPDGTPNPNFGQPVVTGFQSNTMSNIDSDVGRATGYYNLDLRRVGPGWLGKFLGTHLLTATHTRQSTRNDRYASSYAINTGQDYAIANQGKIQDASVQGRDVSLLHYLGASAIDSPTPLGGLITPVNQLPPHGVSSVDLLWAGTDTTPADGPAQWVTRDFDLLFNGKKDMDLTRRASGIRRTRTQVNSTVLVSQDRFFNGKLVTTLGWRRDDVFSYDAGTAVRDPVTGVGINDSARLPLKYVGAVREDTFSWGAVGHAPDFIQKRLPWGTELSLTYNESDNFQPAGQRYDLYDNPIGSAVGETREYGALLSTFNGRFVFRYGHYKTSAAKATVNLNSVIQNMADNIAQVLNMTAQGNNAGNPEGIAAFDQFMSGHYGQILAQTFRLKYDGTSNAWDYDRRTGQVLATSDVVSEGDEFEVVANPTRNWRISFNAAKATAVQANTGLDLQDVVLNGLIPLADGPAGALVQDTSNNRFDNNTRTRVLIPMLQSTLQDGAPTTQLRRWRWNLVTNYRFTEGALKGWNVGAAVRWQDKVAIGFPVIVDPVVGPIPDVHHPYYGPTDTNYDAWIGYSRKLWNKYSWSIQLNVKNLGVGDELIPVGAEPDGTINAWRIAEAQKWTLTNTLNF